MGINGYELQGIAFVRADGPMWRTLTPDGRPALLTLHTSEDAHRHLDRWKKWAQLTSPNIVQLYDVISHDDGRWALVQAEVPGQTLALMLETRDETLILHASTIVEALRSAVGELHHAGLVHGDLAPKNIIITPDGHPILIDLIGPLVGQGATPGWSDLDPVTHAPSIAADQAALERLCHAIENLISTHTSLVAENPTDPGLLLRTHNDLPETERRPIPASWKHLAPQRIVAAGILIATMIGGWGAFRVAASSDTVPSGAQSSHDEASVPPSGAPQSAVDAPTPASADMPRDKETQGASCPTGEEVLARVTQILQARDSAYNHRDAAALPQYVAGEWLVSDQELIATMIDNGTTITGFSTSAKQPQFLGCSATSATVEATLQSEPYTQCAAHGCRPKSGNSDEAPRVLLTLRLPDLVLTSVTEAGKSS